jgi:hypothetical protein
MAFTTYKEAVDSLRRYLNDTPQLNTLDEEYESTDDELEEYIKDALNDMNMNYDPITWWKLTDVVVEPGETGYIPWNTVKLGAVLQLLQMKGIISARNTLIYSDAGGVQVNDMDKWGRYINYYNVLVTKYTNAVKAIKIRQNVTNAFGGYSSPFSFDVY